MKRTPAMLLGASSLLLLLAAASCTDTVVGQPDTDARAITFTPAADTRAAVTGTSLPDGSSFSVWGGYDESTNNVFDGETVTESGGAWTYGGGNRYWIAGKTYNFYAVYPATGVEANVSPGGTIIVTNFDCSKTGADAVDLMTATATGDGSNPAPVALTFNHELARVNIIVTSEGDAVNISDARLYGISHIGSLNGNEWDFGGISDVNAPSFETESLSIPANDTQDYFLFGGDLLLPPHKSLSDNATLDFSYQYTIGDTTSKSASIKLKTSSVTTWEKGKRYNYRINISRNATNVTLGVEVTNWIEKNYTVEW